jgi:hypothetical protein
MSQTTTTGTGTGPSSGHHIFKGLFLMACGVLVGYLWLWGNALQLTTSELWIIGLTPGQHLSIAPQISVFLQITQFWSGPTLTMKQVIAYGWGWINQVILLILAIGAEHSIVSKKRASAFKWICGGFVVLNSLADLSFGNAFGGQWQPWAFAAICCFATFSLGVAAVGLLVEGFKQIF